MDGWTQRRSLRREREDGHHSVLTVVVSASLFLSCSLPRVLSAVSAALSSGSVQHPSVTSRGHGRERQVSVSLLAHCSSHKLPCRHGPPRASAFAVPFIWKVLPTDLHVPHSLSSLDVCSNVTTHRKGEVLLPDLLHSPPSVPALFFFIVLTTT